MSSEKKPGSNSKGELSSLLTTHELAEFLRLSDWTIKDWRRRNYGPKFFRLPSGRVRYSLVEVKSWLEANRGTCAEGQNEKE